MKCKCGCKAELLTIGLYVKHKDAKLKGFVRDWAQQDHHQVPVTFNGKDHRLVLRTNLVIIGLDKHPALQ